MSGVSIMERARALVRDRRARLRIYAVAAAVLAVLCLVPRPYVARAKINPQDASASDLSSAMSALGGQFQGFAALIGGSRDSIDFHLTVARSREVADLVIRRNRLADRQQYGSRQAALKALDRQVDLHSLTGGILEIETRTHDADMAVRLTKSYSDAIVARINQITRERLQRKREIVGNRFRDAAQRIADAEGSLTAFRRANNLAEPEAQLGAELSLRASLQAQLQARTVELETMERFQGPDNPQLQALRSQVQSLRDQIAHSARPESGASGPNIAGLSQVQGQYMDRYRDYLFAQSLYAVYSRLNEQVTVDTVAAETASTAQIVEGARLDVGYSFNIAAVALLVLVIVLALFTEIYAPATGLRLPLIGEPEPRP